MLVATMLTPSPLIRQNRPPVPSDIQTSTIAASFSISSTGKGILIGMLAAFGSASLVALVLTLIWIIRCTIRGRIFLGRFGRPGEFDDAHAFAREEAAALERMDDLDKIEYLRAKAFIEANLPESIQTDISLSQFLAIQEKGVSAWEFEPELEIANCFVEARTEIEFFDSECSVQSNLPVPKQNEVYYWEAKIYETSVSTLISIGMTTKPYPLFRLPGYHKVSVSYNSTGTRRYNQPFNPTAYGPPFVQGDVIGVGYRPRNGTIFFTRNGRKMDDVAHGLKSPNLFPTVGANGPCQVHVNFGQLGFVFIEANVKKWGLAPMTGSLAPPPPYGSEHGSILLEGGRNDVHEGMLCPPMNYPYSPRGHGHNASQQIGYDCTQSMSPGPRGSPTDISLSQFNVASSNDVGEGTSNNVDATQQRQNEIAISSFSERETPPKYESPERSPNLNRRQQEGNNADAEGDERNEPHSSPKHPGPDDPPIPSYDAAVAESQNRTRLRRDTSSSWS